MKKTTSMITACILGISMAITACGGSTSTETSATVSEEAETVQETAPEIQETTPETEAAPAAQVGECVTTILQAAENEVLVYYPTPNAADTSSVKLTCTAPLFIVYGNGAYDETSAAAYAWESGLAEIASETGSSVCFINPIGDTWSEADIPSYDALISLVSDSSTDTLENGIIKSLNWMTGEETQSVCATAQRIYVYGIEAGADFVAANYVKPMKSSITFPDGFTMETDHTATVITLNGAAAVPEIEANDLPVVSIGNSDELNAALEASCGSVAIEESADYPAEYAAVVGNYRRQAGVLIPVHDWAAEGITEKIESATVTTDPINTMFAGSETHEINYVTYYANDLDVEAGNVPLVLCFHGGGNTALYEAEATEWPVIGKENGFITVSVDLHFPNCTAMEIAELVGILEEEYSIDPTRIYASGFSMGSIKSWDIFEQCPELFAGLAPMDGSEVPGTDSNGTVLESTNQDVITPVFYVAGETSPLPEMANQDQKIIDRIAYAFGVNQVNAAYDIAFDAQDGWENPVWGINGDMTYAVTDSKVFTDSTLTVQMFMSADGKYYTALASASNQSHEVYARNSWAAWDFLSQFSRQADGTITISEVTYGIPADDGSVTDNTYNMN